jgi:hypothetical protein
MNSQNSNPAHELQEALVAIAALTKEERTPNRYDARMLLLPLGALILEGDATGISVTLEHIGELVSPENEAWARAMADEMDLAGNEFCLAVNPDYLKLPNYDFAYTATSREQLEQRIQATLHLGFPVSEALESRIGEADAAFEPFLDRADE